MVVEMGCAPALEDDEVVVSMLYGCGRDRCRWGHGCGAGCRHTEVWYGRAKEIKNLREFDVAKEEKVIESRNCVI